MKRSFFSLWSLILIVMAITSCTKSELEGPLGQADPQYKNAGGAKGSGGGGKTSVVTYGGQSTGLDATIWNFTSTLVTSNQTVLARTNFLPSTGGIESANVAPAEIPGSFTADALDASITGTANVTNSSASASNVRITVGSHVITADYLEATANGACGSGFTGSSKITNLVLNGTSITVTGAANQSIYLPSGGILIINEQSSSKKSTLGNISVSALHIILPNVADIRVATARAEIKC